MVDSVKIGLTQLRELSAQIQSEVEAYASADGPQARVEKLEEIRALGLDLKKAANSIAFRGYNRLSR